MEGLQKCFEDAGDPFQGLDTPYLQFQYCKKNLDLVVCIFDCTCQYFNLLLCAYIGTSPCVAWRTPCVERIWH